VVLHFSLQNVFSVGYELKEYIMYIKGQLKTVYKR